MKSLRNELGFVLFNTIISYFATKIAMWFVCWFWTRIAGGTIPERYYN